MASAIAPVRQALLDLAALGPARPKEGPGGTFWGMRVEAEIEHLTQLHRTASEGRGLPVQVARCSFAERVPDRRRCRGGFGRSGYGGFGVRSRSTSEAFAWSAPNRRDPRCVPPGAPVRQCLSARLEPGVRCTRPLRDPIGSDGWASPRSRLDGRRSKRGRRSPPPQPEGASMIKIASVTEEIVGQTVEGRMGHDRAIGVAFTMTSRSTELPITGRRVETAPDGGRRKRPVRDRPATADQRAIAVMRREIADHPRGHRRHRLRDLRRRWPTWPGRSGPISFDLVPRAAGRFALAGHRSPPRVSSVTPAFRVARRRRRGRPDDIR